MSLKRFEHYINGAPTPPESGSYLTTNDPFTGEPIAEFAEGSAADVDRAVEAAWQAFETTN
jgi:aldehyde dehydrogenase